MLATSKSCVQTKINSYNKHNSNYTRSEVGPVLISTDMGYVTLTSMCGHAQPNSPQTRVNVDQNFPNACSILQYKSGYDIPFHSHTQRGVS